MYLHLSMVTSIISWLSHVSHNCQCQLASGQNKCSLLKLLILSHYSPEGIGAVQCSGSYLIAQLLFVRDFTKSVMAAGHSARVACETDTKTSYISTVKLFPPIVDGKIDTEEFLQASTDLVGVIERIGKVFAPVKYDMMGNIEKIRRCYEIKKDTTSCLLILIQNEINAGEGLATEAVLWLNRALLFIELIFQQVLGCVQNNTHNRANMTKILTIAYEGSVKRYHNWVSKQLFSLVCRMCPSLPQILKSFDVSDLKTFETEFQTLLVTLHLVRSKIDDYYRDHNIYQG